MIHFEALGAEARQLERETRRAIRCSDLPAGHVCLIVPESVQAYLLTGGDVLGEDLTAARALVDMALNRTGNVYVQPHQAFHSDLAVKAKAAETIKHLASWYRNNGTRFDDQLPYS
ncbi:MAG TPA: hypothetical protein PL176_08595 [Kiritimatiellia bacterium]|nr:MAG: hypothetical protein BWX70_01126 [Verrucomicrobia bacterium ADurb.Bin070]HPB11733.1 hypothetical protein [Kiritimatiellia bacterium]HPO38053.1 hypothetical protein [Kiritimatiellia bacterium]